jgi:hypothetical protein
MKIILKLQALETGDTSFREFENEEATIAFLRERPRFTDVLGVVFEGLSREQNDRLKAAMRPLDAEEVAAEAKLKKARETAAEAQRVTREAEDEQARLARRESLKSLDPNRPMDVRYHYSGSITPVDPDDTRELTAEVRDAILAWVAERNEWVESRGQIVGEAKLTVLPGELKKGADRVQHGSFVPVTGPAKS